MSPPISGDICNTISNTDRQHVGFLQLMLRALGSDLPSLLLALSPMCRFAP